LSRGTIIVDPGRSLKSQTTSEPPFAIALALRKGFSFQKIYQKPHQAGASHYCISANFSKNKESKFKSVSLPATKTDQQPPPNTNKHHE